MALDVALLYLTLGILMQQQLPAEMAPTTGDRVK
jgi:hypothetical protein